MIDDKVQLLEVIELTIKTYENMIEQAIRENEGFILAYSVTSKRSLEELDEIYQKIKKRKEDEYVAFVLVGNKSDLEEQREVSKEEGEKFAKKRRMDFFEVSAKTKINIELPFYQITRKIVKTITQKNYFFTGNGYEKIFKIGKLNCLNCDVPLINQNLKNIWIIIFKLIFSEKDSLEMLNCKVVCKYWYHLISNSLDAKKKLKIIHFDDFRCTLTPNQIPVNYSSISKYIYVIDFNEYLTNPPDSQLEILRKLSIDKKNIFLVFFDTKVFTENFVKETNHKIAWKFQDAKKNVKELLKLFSKWKRIVVEDLSLKNLTSIFKKVDSKNFKKLIQKTFL